MTWIFLTVIAAIAAWVALNAFVNARPQKVAGTLKGVAQLAMIGVGLYLTVTGRAGLGLPLLAVAAGWFARQRARHWTRTPGGKTTVRSAGLEMELDLDSGAMNGIVLAGSREGSVLDDMKVEDVIELAREFASDRETIDLLEAYLDRRAPTWRDNVDSAAGEGLRTPPGSGAISKEEAYHLLGLEPGASAADIRKAHRRLMQRVHPDVGGSALLAQRINEAKDILLSRHE